MDSNRLLIGIVLALVGFLAFPIVVNKMRSPGTAATPPTTASTAAGQGRSGPTPAPAPANDPKYSQPPQLNEQNLVGSTWQFNWERYKVKLTFSANGIAYATHPMAKALTGMDYIEGRWRVQYDRLFLNASAGGNEINYQFLISGMKLYELKDGKPAGELQRF